MASIQKRGNAYLITISQEIDHEGKRKRITKTYHPDLELTPAKQRKAAEAFAVLLEKKIEAGETLEGEKVTFKAFSEEWLEQVGKPSLEPSTYTKSKKVLERQIFPHIGHKKIGKVSKRDIVAMFNAIIEEGYQSKGEKHQYQYKTLRRILNIVNIVFKTAVEWGVIEKNPCEHYKIPNTVPRPEKIKAFTPEQAKAFLAALDTEFISHCNERTRVDGNGDAYTVQAYDTKYKLPFQFAVFFAVCLYGGLRRGETISLTWEDIDFERNIIHVTKATGKAPGQPRGQYLKAPKTENSIRDVTVPQTVITMLKKLKQQQNAYRLSLGDQWQISHDENGKPLHFIFTQANGLQMYLDTPSQRFTKFIEDYNRTVPEDEQLPKITLHGLRHTMATLLIAEKIEISTVSGRLGHADISTTLDVYTHFLKERDTAAAATLEKALGW